nr:MAG TPA: hypothetical protein [Microviridae sp.]
MYKERCRINSTPLTVRSWLTPHRCKPCRLAGNSQASLFTYLFTALFASIG